MVILNDELLGAKPATPSQGENSSLYVNYDAPGSETIPGSIENTLTGPMSFSNDITAAQVRRDEGVSDEQYDPTDVVGRVKGLVKDAASLFTDEPTADDKRPISKQEFDASGYARPGVNYEPGLTDGAASLRAASYDVDQKSQFLVEKAGITGDAAGFVAGLAEPKNVVTAVASGGIVRGPLVGLSATSSRYLNLTNYLAGANDNIIRGNLMAAGVRGVGEGAAFSGLRTPSDMDSADTLGQDYSMTDALLGATTNMLFMGGAESVHGGFYGFKLEKNQALQEAFLKQQAAEGQAKMHDIGMKVSNDFSDAQELTGYDEAGLDSMIKNKGADVPAEGAGAEALKSITEDQHAEAAELATQQTLSGQRVDVSPIIGDGRPTEDQPNVAQGQTPLAEKVKAINDSLLNPEKSYTHDSAAIAEADKFNAEYGGDYDDKQIDDQIAQAHSDIAALKSSGHVTPEMDEYIKKANAMPDDAVTYSKALSTAAACLTRG